jgi:hypothetical protein
MTTSPPRPAAAVSPLGAAAQALLDQGLDDKARRVALAALEADPADRFALGLLGGFAVEGNDGALRRETLARLAAADPRARGLGEGAPPGEDPATRAQCATWLLDLGDPVAGLALAGGAGGPPSAALLLAEARCRRALGDLRGAAGAYEALLALEPGQAEGRRLLPCLRGQAPGLPAEAAGLAAVPFWRWARPLPAEQHAQLRQAALARLPAFTPAKVHPLPDQPSQERPESRQALRLEALPPETAPLEQWLTARRGELLAALLGSRPRTPRLELQVTLSGEGAFYKAHRDAGDRVTGLRLLTVILYLHRQPRGFLGGELRLYDGDLAAGHWLRGGYTLIPPDDATLLAFPAAATHEVLPVAACAELAAGRLTVNGWFHRVPGAE